MLKISLFMVFVLLLSKNLVAENDSLYVSNGDILIGEIKGMERNVLTMETDYSDSDFKIDWDEVVEIYSNRSFIIVNSEGDRFYGIIKTDSEDNSKVIIVEEGKPSTINIADVVLIHQVDKDFLSRLSASIDFGFSFSKTNNLTQLSIRSNLGYLTDHWNAHAFYNGIHSSQDDVDPTNRNEAGLSFRYFLPADWFILASGNFLQNDEQKLKLRSTTQLGLGNYIVRTNSIFFSANAGAAWNRESYTDPSIPGKSSAEGFAGLELNMFDIGDLSLTSSLVVYPSFTEKGRVRSDFKFDLKYDFPLDIYIKLGYTLNYDNQPVEGAAESDYVFQTTVGWEF